MSSILLNIVKLKVIILSIHYINKGYIDKLNVYYEKLFKR